MSHDVSAIYTSGPSSAGSTVCYNWVHNCHPEIENGKNIGLGIRADDQCRNMSVHHNVVWDVGLDSIIMKGEYHKVYNNTTFHTKPEFKFGNSIRMDTEPEPYKAWRMDSPLFSEQNAHSLVFNNVTGLIRAEHRKSTPFVHRSNAVHNQLNYTPVLLDPEDSLSQRYQIYGLPTVMAVYVLNDPANAFPLALMDGWVRPLLGAGLLLFGLVTPAELRKPTEATPLALAFCSKMSCSFLIFNDGAWRHLTDPDRKAELAIEWGDDFGASHETAIAEMYEKPPGPLAPTWAIPAVQVTSTRAS